MSDEIIYDVGLHTGEDTEFYLAKGFRVVGIDANPKMTDKVRRRFAAHVASGRLIVLNIGITDHRTSEPLVFYVNRRVSQWSSFDKAVAARDNSVPATVNVPCRTMEDVVAEFGEPFYVKIDIEGHDAIALESLLRCPPSSLPRYISVENGNKGMLNSLVAAGYSAFKYVNQDKVHTLQLPRPAREGRYVRHGFPRGASGPFGEEAPGEWMTAASARDRIAEVWDPDGSSKNPAFADKRAWFDLHARRGGIHGTDPHRGSAI